MKVFITFNAIIIYLGIYKQVNAATSCFNGLKSTGTIQGVPPVNPVQSSCSSLVGFDQCITMSATYNGISVKSYACANSVMCASSTYTVSGLPYTYSVSCCSSDNCNVPSGSLKLISTYSLQALTLVLVVFYLSF